MNLDGNDLGIGKIDISYYDCNVRGEDRKANIINIYSNDKNSIFSFYTVISYDKFNKLELNRKTNLITGNLEFIDENDFYFKTEDEKYILTEEDVQMFITKIEDNKFLLELEVKDLNSQQIPISDNESGHKYLRIDTILDFNTLQ